MTDPTNAPAGDTSAAEPAIAQPKMTPADIRAAQKTLGLSDRDFALVLGLENPQHVRRLKADAGKGHHRPAQGHHVRLLRAYLDGYRPDDWPG